MALVEGGQMALDQEEMMVDLLDLAEAEVVAAVLEEGEAVVVSLNF